MLDGRAAKKVDAQGLAARVQLSLGEAERLPFEDGSFDGVSIAFGIRNVADRPLGLREMARVTQAGRAGGDPRAVEPRTAGS